MLRRFAKKVLQKVTGGGSPTSSAPPPASPPAAPAQAEELATISASVQEVKERIDCGEPVVLLDVRTADEVAQGVISGALHIPLQELGGRRSEVENCDEIVCYCAAGVRSLQAATLLRERGVFNATSLDGGVGAWTAVGGALVPLSGT
jgi:rhodanese-related sulfurtransferase